MNRFLPVFIFAIFFSIICTAATEQYDEITWKKVADNNYIDAEGIVGTSDIYGYSFLLKAYNKGQYEPVNGKQISYTLSQYTIDCGKRTYKVGVIDSYGKNDNFINGDYNRFAQFQPIVSGTAISEVANKLCKIKTSD